LNEKTSMAKIHLDTDLGGDIDDLRALALLLEWPGVEITGIAIMAEDSGIFMCGIRSASPRAS